jgi:hypothetical protein
MFSLDDYDLKIDIPCAQLGTSQICIVFWNIM